MTIIKFIFLLFSTYSHIRNIISLDFYCISKKKNKKKIELQVSVLTCLTLFLVFNCYSETSAFSGGSDMNSSPTTYQSRASLVAQLVKNLPAMQETWVRSLGWKDPLEKGMATHSSILAWRIAWTL